MTGKRSKTNDNKRRPKKRVAFGAIADQVHPVIPPKSELSEEDKSLLWYSKPELKATIDETMVIVEVFLRSKPSSSSSKKNKKKKNDGLYTRGLESRIDRQRQHRATRATKAMLEEQNRQKLLGIKDPEALAKAYGAKAVSSLQTALRMAQEDLFDAERALAELDARKKRSVLKRLGRALNAISQRSSPEVRTGERERIEPETSPSGKKGKPSKLNYIKVYLPNHKKRISSEKSKRNKGNDSVSDHVVIGNANSSGSTSLTQEGSF